ncbi:ABC transporter permease subunit [Shewanella intestini]|uniref:ABC transporter permease subunit n=1 Tax=Shewanella intestini TaxID=2017544 RepID=A0ABS5I273_9GAMM|nr:MULTISPECIES: ABC transporter permease subunit [Shewanella]MBR9727784.1 ABC transporter permease subunit [Shewanella intestini]MRG36223.1 ABC transporter permease subunit [Shewanella sp. XMDDZSB0408]
MDHNIPSTMRQIGLITQFEMTKRFINRGGMFALAAFTLVWALIILFPVERASSLLMNPSFKELVNNLAGPETFNQLFAAPVAEYAVLWCIALYVFPMFSLFISADQFCSDKQRGTFRFLTLRVSREQLFFGRFIGQMLIQAVLIIIALLATFFLVLTRDSSLLLPSMSAAFFMLINLIIVLLPYVAVMAVFSLIAKTARQASTFAIVLWTITSIIISIINTQYPNLAFLHYILPGSQISSMINSLGLSALTFAPIPIIQTIILLFLGKVIIQRSAL